MSLRTPGAGRLATWAFVGAVMAAGLAGCDGDSAEARALTVSFYPGGAEDPFADVAFLRFLVEGDDLATPVQQIIPAVQAGQATLNGITYGPGRQVTMEGWTSTGSGTLGRVVSRGRSVKARVGEGDFPRFFSVLFARVNRFLDVEDAGNREIQALAQGRVAHTATPTRFGEVVIAGGGTLTAAGGRWWGADGLTEVLKDIEVVDQRTNAHREHRESMFFRRAWHAAAAFPTGSVILSGGWTLIDGDPEAIKSVEIYNPGENGTVQRLTNAMAVPRAGHTATLVDPAAFTVLFVGGDVGDKCDTDADCTEGGVCEDGHCPGAATYELWNPISGSSGAIALPDSIARRHHRATTFTVAGRAEPAVLITGGENPDGVVDRSLIYDAAGGVMISAGRLTEARTQHSATFVPAQGFIYVVGGFTETDRSAATASIDVYDVARQSFRDDAGSFNLTHARGGHGATALGRDTLLVGGGLGSGGTARDSIEIIFQYVDPAKGPTVDIRVSNDGEVAIPFMPTPRYGFELVGLDSRMGLFVGGIEDDAGAVSLPTDLKMYNLP